MPESDATVTYMPDTKLTAVEQTTVTVVPLRVALVIDSLTGVKVVAITPFVAGRA